MKKEKKPTKKLELKRLTVTQLKGAHGGCYGVTRFGGCTGCGAETWSCGKKSGC